MKKIFIIILSTSLAMTSTMVNARVSCKSFATQQEAQAYYNKRKNAGLTGWKSLDRDKDGQACDCLPGGNGTHCPKRK